MSCQYVWLYTGFWKSTRWRPTTTHPPNKCRCFVSCARRHHWFWMKVFCNATVVSGKHHFNTIWLIFSCRRDHMISIYWISLLTEYRIGRQWISYGIASTKYWRNTESIVINHWNFIRSQMVSVVNRWTLLVAIATSNGSSINDEFIYTHMAMWNIWPSRARTVSC